MGFLFSCRCPPLTLCQQAPPSPQTQVGGGFPWISCPPSLISADRIQARAGGGFLYLSCPPLPSPLRCHRPPPLSAALPPPPSPLHAASPPPPLSSATLSRLPLSLICHSLSSATHSPSPSCNHCHLSLSLLSHPSLSLPCCPTPPFLAALTPPPFYAMLPPYPLPCPKRE
jgi:hypothetical protein